MRHSNIGERCSVEDCGRPARSMLLCEMHYMRRIRTGTTESKLRPTDLERLMSRVSETESCWLWTGHLNRDGYGRIWYQGMQRNAHRVAYELLVGPIAEGLQVDHLCRVRACVRPDHLEAVTPLTNNDRVPDHPSVVNRAKTHCPAGHPYSGRNLMVGGGRRTCRTCHNLHAKMSRQRKKVG